MAAPDKQYDRLVKILMIGNQEVGKSSLLLRYADDSFSSSIMPTLGIDFKIKTIVLDGVRVKSQIWDTAGQERFSSVATTMFHGAMGIMVVYNVCERDTFDGVREWMTRVKQLAPVGTNMVLVGNKCDSDIDREISPEQGQGLADAYKVPFFETSAKAKINVDESFHKLTSDIVSRLAATQSPVPIPSESQSLVPIPVPVSPIVDIEDNTEVVVRVSWCCK